MSGKDGNKPVRTREAPAAPDKQSGSGEGADTAFQAMIHKRKQAETPEGADTAAPATPPAQAQP
jgi:hypothetical protein